MKAQVQILLPFALLVFGANALAQNIVVPTVAVDPGQTAQVSLDYVAGATVTNLDFTMNYDETVVDEGSIVVDCSTSLPELVALTCSVDTAANQVKGIGTNFTTDELSSTNGFAVVDFPVLPGAAIGDSTNGFVANYANASGAIVATQDTTWTLTVNAPPAPDWSSAPNSTTGLDFGSHVVDSGVYPMGLVVTNTGEAGSTLTGDCAISSDPGGVFGFDGDNTLGAGLAANASATITVQCDTGGVLTSLYTGTMSCTHNGDGTTETSITDYGLSCNVTAAPEPAFLGVDNGLSTMDVPEQGDPDATATLTVSNNGDVGTTLNGSCVYTGDTEITVTNGSFSIVQGAAPVDVLATCSGAAEGTYTGSLACEPAPLQTWVAANSPYAVSCTVGPPGDAVYESAPVAGSTIDMTPPASPVLEGSVIPTQALVITNNPPEANDRDLDLLSCGYTGSAEISATAAVTPLAPYASTTVTFSCDSTTAGDFTGTYSCPYDVDGDGAADGTADYTVNCGVRVAESDVAQNPPNGSALTIIVAPGGVGQTSVYFLEANGEGVDGSLEGCSLDDTTYFSILSPTSYPQVIPSGGSLQVLVEGTATDDLEPAFATLTCTYSDSNVTGQSVSWTVGIAIQDVAIPTLSVWGLSLMILTLLGLGGFVIRRRVVI